MKGRVWPSLDAECRITVTEDLHCKTSVSSSGDIRS